MGNIDIKEYIPIETNIERILMSKIKRDYLKGFAKTNGEILYFYIDVNELADEYKNKSILIYTNNNYNLNVYESYINIKKSEVEKISNSYENRKLVYIKSHYFDNDIQNHYIIFTCKNDVEGFNVEVKFIEDDYNLLIHQKYYLLKNETLERNIINNYYTYNYLINIYHELISENKYFTYYTSLINDFEIYYVD